MTVYEMVTEKIIEQLEKGVIPWRKPWKNGGAVSWLTQKPYRGINAVLLGEGEWATFNQIKAANGKVKKGERSSIVVFWKFIEKEDEHTNTVEKIPLLRYYRVFEINSQCEGLESKRSGLEVYQHDPIERCEEIIKGYKNSPRITWEPTGAWYNPSMDHVNVPPMRDFPILAEYYSTTFHELIHSTGHKKRLDREGITSSVFFGSETYSKEELVAEMGAAMLCGYAGIENRTLENSAAYIQSWLGKLREDKTLLVKAGGQAQKAVDHILNINFEE